MQILAPTLSNDVKNRAQDYLRLAIAHAVVGRGGEDVAAYFRSRWPRSVNLSTVEKAAHAPQRKAAVSPGSINEIGDNPWGSELAAERTLADGFAELLRPRTILDRLPSPRRVPFNIKVPVATAGASVRWTAEGSAIQISAPAYTQVSLPPTRIGGVVVLSDELVKFSDPDAEALVRRDLEAAAIAFTDESFLNPSLAPVIGQQPGAATFGATAIESTGSTAAAARRDFRALFDAVDGTLEGACIIMRRRTAVGLASIGDDFGTVTAMGGSLWGVPIVVSDSAPVDGNSPAEDAVVLLDSAELMLADGGVEVAGFREGDVELSDAPDSPATGSTVLTNLWTHGLVAFRLTRYVGWKLRRSGAIAILNGARYAE